MTTLSDDADGRGKSPQGRLEIARLFEIDSIAVAVFVLQLKSSMKLCSDQSLELLERDRGLDRDHSDLLLVIHLDCDVFLFFCCRFARVLIILSLPLQTVSRVANEIKMRSDVI